MLWDFFFKVESGMVVLAKTDWLSPQMHVGPMMGIPIMLQLASKTVQVFTTLLHSNKLRAKG